MVNRKGIIVYFQNKKIAKEVEALGISISYLNPKAGYLTGYVDAEMYEKVRKQLIKNKLVKKVDESLLDIETLGFNE
ncbi:MAG: DUF2129 domain-containing protein [Candidatus Izemoplasmatales bacterium]|jgi:uncharacterized protein YlbG (UPF0298 family)|nr:DUF2129 domain-containing protein [Candidatus Izemoplasmatales bacterium]